MLIENQQSNNTQQLPCAIAEVLETPWTRTKSIKAFGNVSTHIPPFFPYIYIYFERGAAAVQPLRAIRASLVLSLPKPSFVFAHMIAAAVPRQLTPTYPLPHMSIGTCQAAPPCFSCRAAAHSRFFTLSPLTSV